MSKEQKSIGRQPEEQNKKPFHLSVPTRIGLSLLVLALVLTSCSRSKPPLTELTTISTPHYPTSTVDKPTSPNGFDWYNPTGVQQVGEAHASAASNSHDLVQMDILSNTGFGFSIPANATVTGIEAKVNHHASQHSAGRFITDAIVQLEQNGNPVGTNKADIVTQWNDTEYDTVTYGGPADPWGKSWSPKEINDPKFGLNFAPQGEDQSGGTTSADVDSVSLTVSYR